MWARISGDNWSIPNCTDSPFTLTKAFGVESHFPQQSSSVSQSPEGMSSKEQPRVSSVSELSRRAHFTSSRSPEVSISMTMVPFPPGRLRVWYLPAPSGATSWIIFCTLICWGAAALEVSSWAAKAGARKSERRRESDFMIFLESGGIRVVSHRLLTGRKAVGPF